MKLSYLPIIPADHEYSREKNTIELFEDGKGNAILPPNIFDAYLGTNLNHLLTKTGTLTPAGAQWTDATYNLWPYLDQTQRSNDKPYEKYPKTPENKLKYAKFVQELFGSGTSSKFVKHLRGYVQKEMVKRCMSDEDNWKNPDGTDPLTIDDVMAILQSQKMVTLFKSGQKAKVYNKIFHWVKSLTMEDDIGWLVNGVEEYLKSKKVLAVMSHHSQGLRRNGLLRVAVKKGTNAVKVRVKKLERNAFGCELDMSIDVKKDAKPGSEELAEYQRRINSNKFEVILLDSRHVPSTRSNYPAYWLKRISIDGSNDLDMDMGKAVETGISTGKSKKQLHALLDEKFDEQTLDDTSTAVPTPLTENNGRTPSTAAATPNIMDLLSPYADTGASSGKENQQTDRGNTTTRASVQVQQSAANDATDSATSETDKRENYLSFTRGNFEMATAAVPTPLTENNGRTPSTVAAPARVNIMNLLSNYADTGASSGKENQQTVERGHEVNTPNRASVQQSAANNTTDSATSETDEENYLSFTRGNFEMAICSNAIKQDHPCHFALCIPCQMSKIDASGTNKRRGRKRAWNDDSTKNQDTARKRGACNHEDLVQGLSSHTNQSYFTKAWMEKHGCHKCDECNKLIPPQK